MNNISSKFKELDVKQILNGLLYFIHKHNFATLMIFAGALIGFALVTVNDFTSNVSSPDIASVDPVIAGSTKIKLDPETEQVLLNLKDDSDVDVNSNIASYRRSAFSDATVESDWAIRAARLVEDYAEQNGSYPDTSDITSALQSQDATLSTVDPGGVSINQPSSQYTYTASRCDEGCREFLITIQLGDSVYQLGDMDIIRRTWVNDTAQVLDVFYRFEDRKYYPTEKDFVKSLEQFYPTIFKDDFAAEDPDGVEANGTNSDYTYRGIDCDSQGCQNFVLRTAFKDGASYFQQSK